MFSAAVLIDDPVGLGVEDLRVGGRVVLCVGQGDQSPWHTGGRTRLWLRSRIRPDFTSEPRVRFSPRIHAGLPRNISRGLRSARIGRG